jgi:hypothetical protein
MMEEAYVNKKNGRSTIRYGGKKKTKKSKNVYKKGKILV